MDQYAKDRFRQAGPGAALECLSNNAAFAYRGKGSHGGGGVAMTVTEPSRPDAANPV
jgi:hypothetical protein